MAMLLRKAAAGLRPALQPAAVVPRAPTSIHLQPSLPIFHTGRNVIAKTADYGQPTSRKINADYTVWPTSEKSGALSLSPELPSFEASGQTTYVKRQGKVFLRFAPRLPPAPNAPKYDFRDGALTVTLKVDEIAALMVWDPTTKFQLDLKAWTIQAREKSMLTTVTFNAVGVDMFSATVQDPRTRRTVQVDVTAAQMHVIKRSCEFALPYLLGMDQALMPPEPYYPDPNYPQPGY